MMQLNCSTGAGGTASNGRTTLKTCRPAGSERTGMLAAHLGHVVLKTQHILWNTSTALTSLWTKDLGTTGLVAVHRLPGIFIPRPHSSHSENFHKTRVFTREALSLLLVRLERTIHKEDSSGTWSQTAVKQPRIRSGLLLVTRDLSTQPTGDGPSEAHPPGWAVLGPPEIRAGQKTAGWILIKSGQKN